MDGLRDRVTVHWPALEPVQNQKIERALQEIGRSQDRLGIVYGCCPRSSRGKQAGQSSAARRYFFFSIATFDTVIVSPVTSPVKLTVSPAPFSRSAKF